MSCSYYTWKSSLFGGDYYCLKKDSEVNDDIYKRYCRDYNYSSCPIYKGNSDSSSCYLTTACMIARDAGFHCPELETLRRFRDQYLGTSEEGRKLVEDYYSVAPRIVSAINDTVRGKEIYSGIYDEVILPCVRYIETGENEKAKELYCQMVLYLKEKILNRGKSQDLVLAAD